jgi:hypothetical protein
MKLYIIQNDNNLYIQRISIGPHSITAAETFDPAKAITFDSLRYAKKVLKGLINHHDDYKNYFIVPIESIAEFVSENTPND